MDNFDFLSAENPAGEKKVFTKGSRVKILVPLEFGGGHLTGVYEDGGFVKLQGDEDPVNLYGILAWWNGCEDMACMGKGQPRTMEEILSRGQTDDPVNICKGIVIGLFESQMRDLAYPLKVVSVFYPACYEECPGISTGRAKPMDVDIKLGPKYRSSLYW